MGNENVLSRAVRKIDRTQQKSASLGFVVAVVKKYGDDRGSQLASLIAFSAFLAFFPLMLIVVTLTAFLSHRSPALADRIRSSALAQFPVVGAELAGSDRVLPGSGLGLAIGFAGLLWGGFGVTQSLQYAVHEVWHVPHKDRPALVIRLTRGVAVFGLLGLGVAASVVLGLLGGVVGGSRFVGIVGIGGAGLASAALYLGLFWLLSPRTATMGDLLPAAIVAAIGWQSLQGIGIGLVSRQLRRSSQLYGTIGAALGLIAFLLLSANIFLYALEITVVRKQHLWPRSIVQPPLTESDISLLAAMAMQEERRPEEHLSVTFVNTPEPAEAHHHEGERP